MNILVIRIGRVGDMVMITPALRAILDHYPQASIHLLTGPDGPRALRDFDPRITRTTVYNRKQLTGRLQARRLTREISRFAYDLGFCFEAKPLYRQMLASLGERAFFLGENDRDLHYADRCLNTVAQAVGSPLDGYRTSLPVSPEGRARALELLAKHGIREKDLVIGLHPSFSGLKKSWLRSAASRHLAEKRWPDDYFASLALLLDDHGRRAKLPIRVIMDLLPGERHIGEAIAQQAAGKITLMTPPPDFERYKAIIQRMQLLVSPDTGPMHIAAAVNTPVVALFSADKSPGDCGPYMEPGRFTVLQAPADNGLGLAAISPEQALAAILNHL